MKYWGIPIGYPPLTSYGHTLVSIDGLSDNLLNAETGGFGYACALTNTATMKCWNDGGEAEDMPGLSGNVAGISIGDPYTCALLKDRSVRCWWKGDIGTKTQSSYTPSQIQSLPKNVDSIAAGALQECALTVDGAVWCWGMHWAVEKEEKVAVSDAPVKVLGLPSRGLFIAAGGDVTCAVLGGGKIFCGSDNVWGESPYHFKPVEVKGLPTDVITIGIRDDGEIYFLTSSGEVLTLGDEYDPGPHDVNFGLP